MITHAQVKTIKSLEHKKYRDQLGLYIVEGEKIILDLLATNHQIVAIYTTTQTSRLSKEFPCELITDKEMRTISLLTTPSPYLALVKQQTTVFEPNADCNQLILALDGVQDPGNIGTIIRLADWFGVKHLLCSAKCADVFSPKVVQASMGAISRVAVHYLDLPSSLNQLKDQGFPIYGTFLSGKAIQSVTLTGGAVLVMGSEGQGISKEVEDLVSDKFLIPAYGEMFSESLNVATATAIALYEFRRT